MALGAAPKDKPLPPEPTPVLPAEVAWTVPLVAPAASGGAMDAFRVYLPLQDGTVQAFDRATGALLWTAVAQTSWLPVPTADATVYVVGADAVRALEASTGIERWSVAIPSPPTAAMLHAGALLVVATESGEVVAVDTNARAVAWRRGVGATSQHPPAALEGSRLVLTLSDGRVIVLELATGRPVWERALPGTLSAPATGRDRVFVGSTNNFFYALDADSGREVWRWRTGGDVVGAAAAGDRVYFVSLDNILRAVNRDNGNQQWKAEVPTRPAVPPIPVGDVVMLTGVAPRLDGFVGKTGEVLGNYMAPAELQGAPAVDVNLRPFTVALVAVTRDGRITGLRPTRMMLPDPPVVPLLTLPGRELPLDRLPVAPKPPLPTGP